MNGNTSEMDLQTFKAVIWSYYTQNKRCFPWRHNPDPYAIVVSEIMLQQTQTHRVVAKYEQFLVCFPNFTALADATLQDVLCAWQGLGYNRRGLALQATAKKIVYEYGGNLPSSPEVLVTFPGIGKATAASICAFAYNQPTLFIETNIRTVFIHFFFNNQIGIQDSDILPLVCDTVDVNNPREWYYALMDYGVMLKKTVTNPSRKSAHYSKQSKFEGSDRQIRGMILKILTAQPVASLQELYLLIPREQSRIDKALCELQKEGFVITVGEVFRIA